MCNLARSTLKVPLLSLTSRLWRTRARIRNCTSHFSVCASGVDVCRVKGYNESSCGAIITSLGYPRKARADCVMTWLL